MKRLAAFLLAAAMLAGAFAAPAMAEKRLALIIGNSAYRHSGELDNPSHDAQLIASVLRRAGFETTVRIDAERKAMKEAFRAYADDIRAAGKDAVGFFYYAGHGTQVNGVNYLLPVDANIENESQVESEAISASGLMAQLEGAGLWCSGTSPDNRLVEFIELTDHPFWVGTQAHPELKSRPDRPAPLFTAFVKAALARAEDRNPHLLHLDQQGVSVAIKGDLPDGLHVPAALAFHPEFLP